MIRRKIFSLISAVLVLLTVACGGKNNGTVLDLPKDFNSRSDSEKVNYLMEAVTPDSVAVIICKASLGEIPELKIDTFANATLHAYEHYKDDDLNTFSNALEGYKESQPLEKKMKLYKLAKEDDPMGLGYTLGLEYVGQIRAKSMTMKDIDEELSAFRKACGSDMETYRRFIKGFKTALSADKGQGIAPEVYSKYMNIPEN